MSEDAGEKRSAQEICAYLRANVNDALRRPEMWGGDLVLRLLFDTLAFAEGRQAAWTREGKLWKERGLCSSIGLRGAFEDVLPEAGQRDDAIASLYAEFAHSAGWLVTDRRLSGDEHADLVRAELSFGATDRTMSDILESFGEPSVVLGGANRCWPKTLVYVARDGQTPIVCFHVWNAIEAPHAAPVFEDPVLLATRIGGQPRKVMRLTPEGHRRLRTRSR